MHRIDSPASLVPEVATLDPARMARLRRVGWLLDNSIPIPGTRFHLGIDQIIGLVPGIGDLIGGALSLYIIVEAWRLGVPRGLLARMGWNVAVDTLVGEIPLLGDLFDIAFKANIRNLALLDGFASGRSRCGGRAAGSSRCWSPGWCSSPPGRSPWPWSSFASSRGLFQ